MVRATAISRRKFLALVGSPAICAAACRTDSILHVTRPAKSGDEYRVARKLLAELPGFLSTTCVDWLGASGYKDARKGMKYFGRPAVEAYVDDMFYFDLFAVGKFSDPGVAALTSVTCSDLPSDYAAMAINVDGGFFKSQWEVGADRFRGGTIEARREILIHELAHGLIAPDFRHDDYLNGDAQRFNAGRVKYYAGGDLTRES